MIRLDAAGWLMLLLITPHLTADDPSTSPFQSQLFPPELILSHRSAIGLTDEQWDRCRRHLEEGEASANAAQRRIRPSMGQLAELLAADKVDELAALEQLDKLLDAEREAKRVHLMAMIRLRNELTSDQRRMLAAKLESSQQDIRERLQGKLERIQRELQRRAQAGQPPEEAIRILQSFQRHMESGHPDEAEVVLDQIIKMLNLHDAEKNPGEDDAERSPDELPNRGGSSEPEPLARVPVLPREPREAVRRQFAQMEIKDIAWRSISWETCLIEGLRKSREQHKPVILWIFIDRPIDDERC